MRYRKLSPDGDYMVNVFLKDSPETVAQAILTRLRLITGEWFLDTSEGTPWRTQILGKYTGTTYDPALRARIIGTSGVRSIDAYASELDRDTRTLSVTATVTTIYGQTTIEATL